MRKKFYLLILVGAMLMNMIGCVQTPEEDFVKIKENNDYSGQEQEEQKEQEEQQQEQQEPGESKNNVKEKIGATEHENFSVNYEVDDIDIKVDADVHIPDVENIPIVRMERNDFNADVLESYTKLFFGENEVTYENGTKNSFDSENLYKVTGTAENGQGALLRALAYEENSSIAFMTYSLLDSVGLPLPKENVQGAENVCQYTEEEALELAQNDLDKMENTKDYHPQKITYYYNKLENQIEGYRICYKRTYEGIPETYDLTEMDFDEKNAISPYGYDCIEVGVTNDGIVFFDWENPMLPGEVINENATLLSFEEIMDIFKQQVRYSTAMGDYNMDEGGDIGVVYLDEEKGINTTITSITLGYMRVRERDTNGYILIPVWDFQGEFHNGQSILTINAMDGTIVNRKVGY